MSPLTRTFTALLLLVPAAFAAEAQLSPNGLLAQCEASDPGEQQFCRGYIAGVADSTGLCIPADISADTLGNLVTSSLRDSGEQSAAVAIETRLVTVFPCEAAGAVPDEENEQEEAKQGDKPRNWSNKERKPGV